MQLAAETIAAIHFIDFTHVLIQSQPIDRAELSDELKQNASV
jgi:hypothetical protein